MIPQDSAEHITREMGTHHNGDDDKLYDSHQRQHGTNEGPASLALVLAASHDDQERDKASETQNNGEARHETDGAPHGAEVSLAVDTHGLVRVGSAWRIFK